MKNPKFLRAHSRWFCARLLVCVILAFVCAGTAFAQTRQPTPAPAPAEPAPSAPGGSSGSSSSSSGSKLNAITLDVMPLFKGILASNQDYDLLFIPLSLSYERLIVPHMSIGGNLDMYFGTAGRKENDNLIPYFYFGITAAWRYYVMSEQMEKFFIGALFGFNVQSIDGKTKEEDGGFAGPLIGVNFGYRAFMGNTFFLEPSMSYIYAKTGGGPTPLGWQAGLRVGIAL